MQIAYHVDFKSSSNNLVYYSLKLVDWYSFFVDDWCASKSEHHVMIHVKRIWLKYQNSEQI